MKEEELKYARKIEAYWRERGSKQVKCDVVIRLTGKLGVIFGIDSNIVNGFPPDVRRI